MKTYKEYIQEGSDDVASIKELAKLASGVKVINRDTAVMTDSKKVRELTRKLQSMGYESESYEPGMAMYMKTGAKNISVSWDDSQTKATIVVG